MSQRFTEEFKKQAVKQVTDQGYSVASVSERLGVTSSSLYNWIKAYGPDSEEHKQSQEQFDRITQLEKELKRVTMERDIHLNLQPYFSRASQRKIRVHKDQAQELPNKTHV